MLALRHTSPAAHPWQEPPSCDEFRGTGIELQLIDAVDELERAEAHDAPDRHVLAQQVRSLWDELVELTAS